MLKGLFAQSKPFSLFLITVFVAIFMMLFAVASFALLMVTIGLSDFSSNVFLTLFAQAYQSLFVFFLTSLFCAYIFDKKPVQYLHLYSHAQWHSYLYVIFSMFLLIPTINVLAQWNANLHLPNCLQFVETWMAKQEDLASGVTKFLLSGNGISSLIISLFVMSILPAVGEELLFRGVLQNIMISWTKNVHVAIWVVAFIFGVIHIQFFGLVPRVLLGAFFGYLLLWGKTVWLPILAHFLNNAVSVIFYMLKNNHKISFDIDTLGTGETFYVTIVGVVLFLAMTYFAFRKNIFRQVA